MAELVSPSEGRKVDKQPGQLRQPVVAPPWKGCWNAKHSGGRESGEGVWTARVCRLSGFCSAALRIG